MLWATACAHELLSPIWPRYPADTPSDEACWPAYAGPSASSMASVASWPARRLASASVAPGRVYSCRSRCACSHHLRALADQRDLGLALAHHQALDERRERNDGLPGDLAQRRPLVAEDARIAVLVGAGAAGDPHVQQHARQDEHRMLGARVLRVGLDPLELGLGANPFDLELGDEDGHLARGVARRTRPAARSPESRSS